MTLIERIEAAEEPSRELDAEIARALSGNPTYHWYMHFDGEYSSDATAPAYTASLDAAMTLVPEGWGVMLNMSENGLHAQARVFRSHPANFQSDNEAATPALALCAAALKAQEQTDEG